LTNNLFFEIIALNKEEVDNMYKDRIELTSQDILEKDFKIDTRGYRPQEVDRFLDIIIKDYDEMVSIIRELESDKKELLEENMHLKKEVRNLRTKLDVIEESDSGVSGANADILRRLSNLEKVMYGKE
jgi:DivIVA domain-containing protein